MRTPHYELDGELGHRSDTEANSMDALCFRKNKPARYLVIFFNPVVLKLFFSGMIPVRSRKSSGVAPAVRPVAIIT